MAQLESRRVAFLVTDGFEESELLEPVEAIREAGGEAVVITPGGEPARAWSDGEWGEERTADMSLEDSHAEDFDALVLPGGVLNPDSLRTHEGAMRFVKSFVELGRPVGAICHGPWSLVEADVVRNRTVTSWPSLRTDLENAGARWVDKEVVADDGLVTSRNPADLPAFCDTVVEKIAEAPYAR